jgi:dihydrofolate reductase
MWWSSLDVSSVTASATHALGPRRSPGGGPPALPSISLTGVTEEAVDNQESGQPRLHHHSVLELSAVVAAAMLQDPDCEGVTKTMRLHNAVASPTAMTSRIGPSLYYSYRSTALEENDMTATYTFDVFSSLDGYGAASGNWTGYWGKQGPELLDHRLALYGAEQRMVFGANTYRAFERMLASSTEGSEVRDPWVTRMRSLPATVVSTTLEGPLNWPNATLVSGDAVDVVARLKEESEVPLRSHGSLSLNRALMAAGLVDHVQVTLFPVITGQTGLDPIFQGAADFDLELVENRTLDSHIQELIYRPTLH